jgi:hypothetical protein
LFFNSLTQESFLGSSKVNGIKNEVNWLFLKASQLDEEFAIEVFRAFPSLHVSPLLKHLCYAGRARDAIKLLSSSNATTSNLEHICKSLCKHKDEQGVIYFINHMKSIARDIPQNSFAFLIGGIQSPQLIMKLLQMAYKNSRMGADPLNFALPSLSMSVQDCVKLFKTFNVKLTMRSYEILMEMALKADENQFVVSLMRKYALQPNEAIKSMLIRDQCERGEPPQISSQLGDLSMSAIVDTLAHDLNSITKIESIVKPWHVQTLRSLTLLNIRQNKEIAAEKYFSMMNVGDIRGRAASDLMAYHAANGRMQKAYAFHRICFEKMKGGQFASRAFTPLIRNAGKLKDEVQVKTIWNQMKTMNVVIDVRASGSLMSAYVDMVFFL